MIKEGEKIKEESKVDLAFKEIVQMTTNVFNSAM